MRKQELAEELARRAGVSRAVAADRLDQVIHDILSSLRRGQSASLPGLGTFTPGPQFRFRRGAERGRRK